MRFFGKTILIIFCAAVITALGIDAADTLTGSEGTLLSQVISVNEETCPKGMNEVNNIPSISCVDTYEASASKECPSANPEQLIDSIRNLDFVKCSTESKESALPWRFITRDQAMQMCSRAGKRLPTNEEWYALSLGTAAVDSSCNVSSGEVSLSGEFNKCVSSHGVYDLVGNVWEWVSDDVIDGMYKTTKLPESGYVAQVDSNGMATVSDEESQELFGDDYFWSNKEGAYGVIRGGYHDSESDAGIYSVHADTLPTTASIGIGFRCVQ